MRYFRIFLNTIAVVVLSLLSAGNLYSQADVEVCVNDDYSGSDQSNPRLAVSASGEIMIVWTDKRYSYAYIFSQILDSSVIILGYNQQVNDDYSIIPHVEPAITASGDNFTTVWTDYRNGDYPYAPDIYLASLDSAVVGENKLVTVVPPEMQCESPDIGIYRNGNRVVVWSDYRYNNWDIFGQRMDAEGELIGNPFRINDDYGNNPQHSPRVAMFPNDGFVVVWYDNRNGDDDIYYQRYDSSATKVGSNVRVNSDNTEIKQAFPAVAADGNGRFYIAWIDWINGDYPQNPDVYWKRYDSSGTVIGSATRVNGNDYSRAQKQVNLCADNIGSVCIVWADSNYGQWDVIGQIYDPNGDVSGGNFRIHADTTGKQLQPDVATDGYRFYFTWADSRNGDFDIYAGKMLYNDPVLVAIPNNIEFNMEEGGAFPEPASVLLDNSGFGSLSWNAVPYDDWYNITPTTGSTPDTVGISITNDSLPQGTYISTIRLIDLTCNDSSQVISVSLNVTEPSISYGPDTVQFFSTNAMPGGLGVMPVYLYLMDSACGGYIPISHDTSTTTLDSIAANFSSLPSFVDYFVNVNSSGIGELGFRINEQMINDSIIPAGNYHLGNLFFTAGDIETFNTIDSGSSDSSGVYILTPSLNKRIPTIVTGNLIVSQPTSVDDDNRPLVPEQPRLEQNYPNPFNAATSVELYLPRTIDITVGIYNLLGQPVCILHDGNLSQGDHVLKWDGRLENGSTAPSGIYYCRMVSGNEILVCKMVLLR